MITVNIVKLARSVVGDLTDLAADQRQDGSVTLHQLEITIQTLEKARRVMMAVQSCISKEELNMIIAEEPQP